MCRRSRWCSRWCKDKMILHLPVISWRGRGRVIQCVSTLPHQIVHAFCPEYAPPSILSVCFLCAEVGSELLVKMSTIIYVVDIHTMSGVLDSTKSRTKWCLMSMCFLCTIVMVLVASASHPALSSNIGVGPPATSPKLRRSCLRNHWNRIVTNNALYRNHWKWMITSEHIPIK